MRFHVVSRLGKLTKLLVRGDSEGQVIVWTIPDVTNNQLAQIKQEDFKLPPGIFFLFHININFNKIKLFFLFLKMINYLKINIFQKYIQLSQQV